MTKVKTITDKHTREVIHPRTEVGAVEGLDEAIENKQEKLVSGETIKTVNNQSLLGPGNLYIQGDGTAMPVDTTLSDTSENPVQNKVIATAITYLLTLLSAVKQFEYETVAELPENPSEETMGIIYLVPSTDPQEHNIKNEFITIRAVENEDYIYYWEQIGSTAVNLTGYVTFDDLTAILIGKQDALVSGLNIKTINSQSLLGSGNLDVGEGMAIQGASTQENGLLVLLAGNGDTITVDLNHNHPQYPKYELLSDESELPDSPDSGTLYLIEE